MKRQKIPLAISNRVRNEARSRCGYCLTSEILIGMAMELDHLVPHSSGGKTVEENLWLACRRYNEFKGAQITALDLKTGKSIALFNPRLQIWAEHFKWNTDGTEIIGTTACGRATVQALKLNHEIIAQIIEDTPIDPSSGRKARLGDSCRRSRTTASGIRGIRRRRNRGIRRDRKSRCAP